MLLKATEELCEWEFLFHCQGQVGEVYLMNMVQHEPEQWVYYTKLNVCVGHFI